MRKICRLPCSRLDLPPPAPLTPAAPEFSGGVGTNVGDSIGEPMVVTTDNGNVREQPNASSKILTTVPHGKPSHDDRDRKRRRLGPCDGRGLDGYMDLVQLDKAPAKSTYGSTDQGPTALYGRRFRQRKFRAQPTNESALLVTLPRGSRVALVGSTASGWSISRATASTVHRQLEARHAGPANLHRALHGALRHGDLPAAADLPGAAEVSDELSVDLSIYRYSNTPSYRDPDLSDDADLPGQSARLPLREHRAAYGSNARVVNGGGGTVHQAPDAQSPLLTTLPPGYQVSVLGSVNGNWAHVVANGVDGYIAYYQLQ